ncbi:NAD(P)/FAD-dependent oxidoreductase [Streptomyces sp. Root369]|uniref:flavin-containing monooxygenase n=1 Tax=Streptomyces sp. Root369 TaxID=1736523 RepID=UPI00070B0B8A|nr:NAD(P)/FAD-dependent oxidoreductase [Streptomyces sp. Root369]KQW14878.1 monooxygenase [Streptomyces sp. Root369]
MATPEGEPRKELLHASDETIEDSVRYADPMVLRGLLYQLTGDEEVAATKVKTVSFGALDTQVPYSDEDIALLQYRAAQFLKTYRDAGVGDIGPGPAERLPVSLMLAAGQEIPEEDMGLWLEDLALNPWARALQWQAPPPRKRLEAFHVTVIGAGMGGLNAAVQLKRAGIAYTVIEKNAGVGGTWWENRYPGCRVDSPSRAYTHLYGVDFGLPYPFCPAEKNAEYFDWVADEFDVRTDIVFDTEVRAMEWDEDSGTWAIHVAGPQGERTVRSNAVISAVGFLNRPSVPQIEGAEEFDGPSWHTARWPDEADLAGKRVAVIGTGCTGYQLVPELALEAGHVTVFQRTPQWLFEVPGYRSPFPGQVTWLDRNLPYHTNFVRFRATYATDALARITEIDPGFDDAHALSAVNKAARDNAVAFLERKLGDPELVKKMTPPHPVLAARPVLVDSEYSVLDAIQRDSVTLVTDGIRRINRMGIEADDGTQHDLDAIVYATGFRARDYLFPMKITGRGGLTLEELWSEGGARAYKGCMLPGFPNLWTIYGPNTSGMLNIPTYHELITVHALECIERLILDGKKAIMVKEEPYWRFNEEVDRRNLSKTWSDPRARSYYWTELGRTATQCPFSGAEVWRFLRHPDFADLEIR